MSVASLIIALLLLLVWTLTNGLDIQTCLTDGTCTAASNDGEYSSSAEVVVDAHHAAYTGDVQQLKRIAATEKGDLFKEDENGWQPIHEAARAGHLEAVQLLVEHGAHVNPRPNGGRGQTPMQLVTESHGQNHPMIRFLESAGALHIGPGACKGRRGILDIGPEAANRAWANINSHFVVAGVNLGLYGQSEEENQTEGNQAAGPFELFDDFNIEDLITGNERWEDLMGYRRLLERPSLSFYVDKVARKRWLPSMGIAQPHVFAIKYAHELVASEQPEDVKKEILSLLPSETDHSYAAKPTHLSLSDGVLLVGRDIGNGTTFSDGVQKLAKVEHFDPETVADSLAKSLYHKAWDGFESWALVNVKPGFVVEERFTSLDCYDCPPLEVKLFTIWGRVWVAQLTYDDERGSWCGGFVHRNGTAVEGTAKKFSTIPDWVNWPHLVDVAERLGAHKDMFRTDMFVGVPAGSLREGATEEERVAALQYVVSETEVYPTTLFAPFDELAEEGARLWVAGYKLGNYLSVPNTEVPPRFLETGSLPLKRSSPVRAEEEPGNHVKNVMQHGQDKREQRDGPPSFHKKAFETIQSHMTEAMKPGVLLQYTFHWGYVFPSDWSRRQDWWFRGNRTLSPPPPWSSETAMYRCIGKVLVVMLFLRLEELGILSLDDVVVVGEQVMNNVTLRQIFSNTVRSDGSKAGEEFEYSNDMWKHVPEAVHAATGMHFLNAMQHYVLDPMGVTGSFDTNTAFPPYAARGFVGSLDDMLLIGSTLAGRGVSPKTRKQVVSAASIESMLQDTTALGNTIKSSFYKDREVVGYDIFRDPSKSLEDEFPHGIVDGYGMGLWRVNGWRYNSQGLPIRGWVSRGGKQTMLYVDTTGLVVALLYAYDMANHFAHVVRELGDLLESL